MADDFSKAKVGDKVFSLLYGWGTITYTNFDCTYPITAGRSAYTLDGKFLDLPDSKQVLFWGEPSIVAPPMPPRKVKKYIRGRYTTDGKLYISGSGMWPALFDSEESARDIVCEDQPIAFIVEVEIEER